jgi:predicted nucleic acid-binding protein
VKYLLDTCFLSELVKAAPNHRVKQWLENQESENLFVSALTLAELHRGIAKMPASKRKMELSAWMLQLDIQFEDRVLAFSASTAMIWGHLCAKVEAKGKPMPLMDALMAAVALEHGLCLVTRNERDFAQAPVLLINPWVSAT